MKAIILAGGTGSRLNPTTFSISKQLLPVYDKPMIYYPLSLLMLSDINEILIITSKEYQSNFLKLLGNGKKYGLNISFAIQQKPNGIAESFLIGRHFIKKDNVCLILGDNLFYGHKLVNIIKNAIKNLNEKKEATIFGFHVNNPEKYGVAKFNKKNNVIKIIEKPKTRIGSVAITGLYFYPNDVIKIAEKILPSKRGELEITDINNYYIKEKKLNLELLGRGYSWLDMGSPDSLLEASFFIQTLEKRQGLKIACIEEIAYNKKLITKQQLKKIIKKQSNNQYQNYLNKLLIESG